MIYMYTKCYCYKNVSISVYTSDNFELFRDANKSFN